MFSHPGERIKNFSVIFAVLLMIFGFIGGIIIAIDVGSFWIFLLILLGSFASAFLTGVFLYGFGTLVQSSEANEENTRQILELLRERPRQGGAPGPAPKRTAPAPAPAAPAEPFSVRAEAPAEQKPAKKNEGPVVPIPQAGEREKCPVCMTLQRAGRNLCMECGVPFIREEPEA